MVPKNNKKKSDKKKKKSENKHLRQPHKFRSVHDTFYEKGNLKKTMIFIRELNKMTNLRIKKNMIEQKIKKLKAENVGDQSTLSQVERLEQMGQVGISDSMTRLEKDLNWKKYLHNKRRINVSSYSNLGY